MQSQLLAVTRNATDGTVASVELFGSAIGQEQALLPPHCNRRLSDSLHQLAKTSLQESSAEGAIAADSIAEFAPVSNKLIFKSQAFFRKRSFRTNVSPER